MTVCWTKRIYRPSCSSWSGGRNVEKVQAFSIETAGHLDLDCELTLVFSSLGTVKFEFTGNCDIKSIAQLIASSSF